MTESSEVDLEGGASYIDNDHTNGVHEIKGSPHRLNAEPPKKKRRVVKPNPEKKFECKHDNCGKSYSRAEHLYRHQLNHSPKVIFRCDYPECTRTFVRQDLCIRHKERHSTFGSQLHKRDSFAQSTTTSSEPNGTAGASHTPTIGRPVYPQPVTKSNSPEAMYNQAFSDPEGYVAENVPFNSNEASSRLYNSDMSQSNMVTEARLPSSTPYSGHPNKAPSFGRTNSSGTYPTNPDDKQGSSRTNPVRRQSASTMITSTGRETYAGVPNDEFRDSSTNSAIPVSPSRSRSGASASHNNLLPFQPQHKYQNEKPNTTDTYLQNHMPINGDFHHNMYRREFSDSTFSAPSLENGHAVTQANHLTYSTTNPQSSIDPNLTLDYSVLGGGHDWPQTYAWTEDFAEWLLSGQDSTAPEFILADYGNFYGDGSGIQLQGPQFSQSPSSTNTFTPNMSMQHPMSMTNILQKTPATTDYIMSEVKRQRLLDVISRRFVERPSDPVMPKEDLFKGDIDNEKHILSLNMMHTYIGSYWFHQHAQLPILHRPTFSADNENDLLLLAVIAIGAATLGKVHSTELMDSAAEFANFIIWHLRWEIVREPEFRPPAKLWVFQTLLLIEIYEKMYATRVLHERSHLHHDLLLTLIRRSSLLQGRAPADLSDRRSDGQKSSSNMASDQSRSEESWHRWIENEAFRRAGFGAFVLDSIHATMFGHAAKMFLHEIRLPLPCDEGLWSAMSPAEVGRVQSSLQTNGIKPTMFLEGLKKTLLRERVHTNSFGRTILMAGLLSFSWHMTQRDLQMSSLGPKTTTSFGGFGEWKKNLLVGFDSWKRDFDSALRETARPALSPLQTSHTPPIGSLKGPADDENIFESRTVLHHLAHIAAHVEVVDCQVFAGASSLLGRSITPKDYNTIQEKITRWAQRASARDAAFYALKFIAQVLLPPPGGTDGIDLHLYGHASRILPFAFENHKYIARDDFLLNRPWILYTSALVVWCYGYALEGPIKPRPRDEDFQTYEQREQDMRDFLSRVGGVVKPDDLNHVPGKNRCLGLLLILQESFASTRWELTQEASQLLGTACAKLRGDEEPINHAGEGKSEMVSTNKSRAAERKQRASTANTAKI